MDDETLSTFLNGSQGVAGLDLARELVATQKLLQMAQEENEGLIQRASNYAATAEVAMADAAISKDRLHSICEALANMHAGIKEYLGNGQ